MSDLKRLIHEIHRRSLWQVLAIYIAASWVVFEVVQTVTEGLGLPRWFPVLAALLLLIGLPIVLATAFVQEGGLAVGRTDPTLIPDAGETADAARARTGARRLLTWRNAMTVGLLALALWGVVATGWYVLYGGAAAGPAVDGKSVAVLPLANMSADLENEYFADGMTEELISKLSRIEHLQVAARTSVARFKDTEKDIREIAEELGVRYVLEGSVRRAGDRVRITAQLIDASSGFHLWSDDFDGELKDVFAVQEETALKIAEALDLQLSPQETEAVRRRYTENIEAYDAYLRGWALIEATDIAGAPERNEAARKHFERALALDPDYPLALVGLATTEYYYYWTGVERTPERLQRAEELARRALALDPQLSEGYAALGDIYGLQEDWGRGAAEFRRALRLNPQNAWAWEELAWVLNFQRPPDPIEAEKAAREAARLRPGWFWAYYQLGTALRLQARYEEAIAAFEHAVQLNPTFRGAYLALGQARLGQGDYGEALAQFNEARRLHESPGLLLYIAAAHAGLGDRENALAELEEALAGGYRDLAAIETDPDLATLRGDPDVQALLEKYK